MLLYFIIINRGGKMCTIFGQNFVVAFWSCLNSCLGMALGSK